MTPALRTVLALIPVIMFALMAGFFYAYSVSVMPGLDRTEPVSAIKSMQGINRAVRNPVFLATYTGAPIASLLVGILFWRQGVTSAGAWLIAAALIYVAGVLLPTGAINVTMNDALAAVSEAQAAASGNSIWTGYSPTWSLWNAARTATSIIALFCAALALQRCGPA